MADILVVEDDDDVGFLVGVFLEQAGHVVRRARNGEHGLMLVAESLPSLTILDVEMPILDGPGMAARLLVENAGRERIPVLLLSGVRDLRSIAERIGTPYALAKPFEPRELLEMVSTALREGRAPVPGVRLS